MAVSFRHVIGRRLLLLEAPLSQADFGSQKPTSGLVTTLEVISPALTGILLCLDGMQHLLWLIDQARRVAMLDLSYAVTLTLLLCSFVVVVLGRTKK